MTKMGVLNSTKNAIKMPGPLSPTTFINAFFVCIYKQKQPKSCIIGLKTGDCLVIFLVIFYFGGDKPGDFSEKSGDISEKNSGNTGDTT